MWTKQAIHYGFDFPEEVFAFHFVRSSAEQLAPLEGAVAFRAECDRSS
ncbi:MAG: hypothetical protein IRZ16_12550 [Myxococcaceae bacterium]|nr:hypothetical protein [Myxococcaceae bacterium]